MELADLVNPRQAAIRLNPKGGDRTLDEARSGKRSSAVQEVE